MDLDPRHRLDADQAARVISPGLVVFPEIVEENLDKMIRMAGSADRLRPHCKTHKIQQVAELQLGKGIQKHKCATFAEAEMLARAGARDIFLAYNLVGPNIARGVQFRKAYPDVSFSATVDHPAPLAELDQALGAAGQSMTVLLDVNAGLRRTGVEPGDQAAQLYSAIARAQCLEPGGLHVYDGHHHQSDYQERSDAVLADWKNVLKLVETLKNSGLPVPRIVAGGSGSFPVYASLDDPLIELSPGTCVFHDAGYARAFPETQFTPAALLLTRVISRPCSGRATFDLGTKACASDPPAGNRLLLPELPDAKHVLQNEEHLVVESSQTDSLQPGDWRWAIPMHICPTSALHKEVFVAREGKIVDRWAVIARDRWLSI